MCFWEQGMYDLECFKQYSILNPLFFPFDNQIGSLTSEAAFLHLGEREELFYF